MTLDDWNSEQMFFTKPETRAVAPPVAPDDEDQAQLEALGFQSDFKRNMSPWANFSLRFT
ncbi:hypothetical protein [Mycobacterium tilburgii]|uniref:hypothetical protein n=1 Tax=Mycobacterium tilburgii TaxID=44467 RepID=UPI0021B201E7|nr:hypothetical protein [Mycobacterium tilburgii]